jgi:esterase/lipase superfamily enzyme
MLREYHKWFSHRLNRDMELLVFGHGGPRVTVFPTRQGRFFDYENFGLVNSLRDRLEAGALQLFCVDSADSEALYSHDKPPQDRIARHNAYEAYILEEVVPFTQRKNEHPRLVAHGCSIGAYHSVNIAFRHPDIFHEVVAFSGRFDLTRRMGDFRDLFDGYYDENIYFHTPNHFIPNLSDQALLSHLRRMRILLAIGAQDPFFESNMALSNALNAKEIPHELYVWDGEAHRSAAWRQMVRFYLAAS